MTNPLRAIAAAASDELDLPWATVVSAASGQCACRLGIWSVRQGGEPRFTPGAWEWTSDELLAAMYGRFLLETAMELEGSEDHGSTREV